MAEHEKENTAQAQDAPAEGTAPATGPAGKSKGGKAPKAPKASDTEAKLAAAETRLAEAEQAAEEAKNTLLRTAAEYDNYRRRTQKEMDAAFGHGVAHAALELLPVIDTLEVAAAAETTDEEYKKGVLLTLAQCEDAFKKMGITEIEAMGCPFDPELHNAVMQEAAGCAESGTITRVLKKGYIQNGKVVRHTMVAVAP